MHLIPFKKVLDCWILLLFVAVPINWSMPSKQNYIQFLAGFEIIKNDTHQSHAQIRQRMDQLTTLSGVTAAEMQAFIGTFRNKPADWKLIQEKVRLYLSETSSDTASLQKQNSTQSPLKMKIVSPKKGT